MSRSETSREVSVTRSSDVDALGPLARAVDERAAVRLDQAARVGDGAHAATCGRDEAELLELRDRRAARSPRASCASVSTTSSGARRRLVRVVDAGEALDLARERLLVEALDVAARALVDRGGDVAPRRTGPTPRPSRAPCCRVSSYGRDRGRDHGAALAREPRGDPADPLDVRVAVLLREAEALREVRADGVAVEVLDDQAARSSSGPTRCAIVDLPDPERPVNQSVKPPVARRGRTRGARGRRCARSCVLSLSFVVRGCRTRACPSRPSGRRAPPRPAPSAGCRGCSRSSGSRCRAAGCRGSR